MEDPVAISLKAGAGLVGRFFRESVAGALRVGCPWPQRCLFDRLSSFALHCLARSNRRMGVAVSTLDALLGVSPHGRAPRCFDLCEVPLGLHERRA